MDRVSRTWWRHVAGKSHPWAELEEFPRLAPDEQRRILATRLLAQVQHFGRRADALPEWREAARIEDPDDLWQIWRSLPIVDKQLLHRCFPATEMQARFGLEGAIGATGGSTGEPMQFFHDRVMLGAALATATYTRLKMGWQPGMATVIVWGSDRDIGLHRSFRGRLRAWLARDILFAGFGMTRETTEHVIATILRRRPVALYGFTSLLEEVARLVLETRGTVPPGSVRTAWNGAEMLFPEQAEIFRRAFGVPLLNRYGGRELSVMACQFAEGESLQVLRPWLFVEIVDDRGTPVKPGQPGRMLWTSTICRGTPFLRYDVGDLAVADVTREPEAGVTALRELQGRVASLLELPDGRKLSNLYWNHLFKEFPEVRQFQVVITGAGGVHLLLRGEGFAPTRETVLRAALRIVLRDLAVKISWVDVIPLTPAGKLVQVRRA